MSLNKVILMGRITKDLEIRKTQSGVSVCSFTVAVDRPKNGNDKVTDFIDCVAWRGTADFVSKYFGKGRMIIVEGSLQSRKWTDKNGQNRIAWEVQVQSVYFGDSKREDSSNTYDDSQETPKQDMQEVEDDGELPF